MTTPLPTGTLTFLFTDIEGSTQRWEQQREAHGARPSCATTRSCARPSSRMAGTCSRRWGTRSVRPSPTPTTPCRPRWPPSKLWPPSPGRPSAPTSPTCACAWASTPAHADARGGDYFGPALNRTARLMSAGHGGQVLLSLAAQQVVRDYLPEGVTLRDLGEHRLKDLRHSEHLYQLVAPDLPDNPTPPTTAEKLTAAERIVVAEPGAGMVAGVEAGPGPEGVAPERTLPESMSALLDAIRGDEATVTLTADQAREIAQHRPQDLTEYRLGRIAEWSQPRYRLDGRFVALTLLVDQGEDATAGRWAAKQERYDDLAALVAAVPEPAVVVLGPPGAGKSTLLRHLELGAAIAALAPSPSPSPDSGGGEQRGAWGADVVTFFIQLNQYKAERPGDPTPAPGDWLSAHWAARYPDLPPLDDLLAAGRAVLLLDAFNEMPAASEREFRERVGWWKDWLVRLAQSRPGNRVVFSCRTLDYSAAALDARPPRAPGADRVAVGRTGAGVPPPVQPGARRGDLVGHLRHPAAGSPACPVLPGAPGGPGRGHRRVGRGPRRAVHRLRAAVAQARGGAGQPALRAGRAAGQS